MSYADWPSVTPFAEVDCPHYLSPRRHGPNTLDNRRGYRRYRDFAISIRIIGVNSNTLYVEVQSIGIGTKQNDWATLERASRLHGIASCPAVLPCVVPRLAAVPVQHLVRVIGLTRVGTIEVHGVPSAALTAIQQPVRLKALVSSLMRPSVNRGHDGHGRTWCAAHGFLP